jgi:endoglucanase
MCKKVFYFVLLMSVFGNAFGDVSNYWVPTSGNWQIAGNWSLGSVPTQPNTDPVVAIVNTGTCTVDSNTGSDKLIIGYDTTGAVQPPTVNVSAGNDFHIRFYLMFGSVANAVGILNLNGTVYAERLQVGIETGSTGTINIGNGGLLTIGAWGCYVGMAGAGTINLNGTATMIVCGSEETTEGHPGITMGSTGHIDIEDGALKVNGDRRKQLADYIAAGKITGYDGAGTVTAPSYDPQTGFTTVTAFPSFHAFAGQLGIKLNDAGHIDIRNDALTVPGDRRTQLANYIAAGMITGCNGTGIINAPFYDEKTGVTAVTAFERLYVSASQPIPLNGATWVPLNTTLSWVVGMGAKSHNVYFGTTSPGSFRGNQTETTFNPGTLAPGTTYYWRIDEVNGPNTFTGTVRSFTTKLKIEMKLKRGISIDRQFLKVPPRRGSTIETKDIQIIKSMGFEFVKVLINPACFMSDSTINPPNMCYLDDLIGKVLAEGLPVVLSLHPQTEFKTTYLGTPGGFANLVGFYKDLAAYMAARWDPNELAFQLMSEPTNNYQDWNIEQHQIWRAIRSTMPHHTLILVGDEFSIIDALLKVEPVDDNNVYYSFTTYLPYIFTFQGSQWSTNYFPWITSVPYPSLTKKDPDPYILPGCPEKHSIDAHIILNEYFSIPWDMNQQRALLKPITAWNRAHGGKLKIWCAEFGALDRKMAPPGGGSLPADRIQFIHDRRQAFEELNIGWAYWSYNETFTVFNPDRRAICSSSPSYDWIDPNTLDALGLRSHTDGAH